MSAQLAIDILLAVAQSAPGLISGIAAALGPGVTEAQAIEAARTALPARLEPTHPDPDGDAAQDARLAALAAAQSGSPIAEARLILATHGPAVRLALASELQRLAVTQPIAVPDDPYADDPFGELKP